MGQPAARMGDTTAHGGVIVKGEPTVLIKGMPAARVGDMHTCPMQTPAVPPIPHVGGPILPPGAPTVLIKGLPAARLGDMCVCTGPPDSIIKGEPTVLIGSGGGGGGAGAGFGKAAGNAKAKATQGKEAQASDSDTQSDDDEAEESHKLDVSFEDKSGFPITGVGVVIKGPDNKTEEGALFGKVRKFGVKDGDHEISVKAISDARWSATEAKVGDKVELQVKTVGIDDNEPLILEIYIKDANAPDYLLHTINAKVSSDEVEEEWELQIDDEWLERQDEMRGRGRYSMPSFYFLAISGGIRQKSGLLQYNDWIDIDLEDDEGNKLGGQKYRLHLPSGEVREGVLDDNGHAREENIPPGRCGVEFPELYSQSDTQSDDSP